MEVESSAYVSSFLFSLGKRQWREMPPAGKIAVLHSNERKTALHIRLQRIAYSSPSKAADQLALPRRTFHLPLKGARGWLAGSVENAVDTNWKG
jgi:hypothetical protein